MAKGTVNKVILIGRLGQDPDLRYTPSGTAVTTLSVATNEVWRDRDGNNQERTEWHRVVLWGKQAETAGEYLKKGSRIYIEGRLQTRNWEDKDGNRRYTTEVIASRMQFMDGRQESQAAAVEIPPPPEEDVPPEAVEGDDLPF